MPNLGNPSAGSVHFIYRSGKITYSKTFTIDSILKKTLSKTFTLDAILVTDTSGPFTTNYIIKYQLSGVADTRERPSFNFEYPQTIYVVLK